jgi:UDP-N-acetylmuramyl pentapeptide phosphotransferase/UDP-N-acetylglucosamine-1-phosphate transferase
MLTSRDIVDRPGDRTSHSVPTPRGAGVVIAAVILAGWSLILLGDSSLFDRFWGFILAFLLLACVSIVDDYRDVTPAARLAAQFVAVTLGLFSFHDQGLVFQGLVSPWLDVLITAIGWVWLVNIFNFMDGTDGMTVVEAVCVGTGVLLVVFLADLDSGVAYLAAVLVGAMLGFAPFNWHPARAFLGDSGSIPVGFVAGWLLVTLALRGEWVAALVLPLYYIADATLTLLRRLGHGERPWHPHREHYYQLATPPGSSHSRTALLVLSSDCCLVLLAVVSIWAHAFVVLVAAGFVVAAILIAFSRMAESSDN